MKINKLKIILISGFIALLCKDSLASDETLIQELQFKLYGDCSKKINRLKQDIDRMRQEMNLKLVILAQDRDNPEELVEALREEFMAKLKNSIDKQDPCYDKIMKAVFPSEFAPIDSRVSDEDLLRAKSGTIIPSQKY